MFLIVGLQIEPLPLNHVIHSTLLINIDYPKLFAADLELLAVVQYCVTTCAI